MKFPALIGFGLFCSVVQWLAAPPAAESAPGAPVRWAAAVIIAGAYLYFAQRWAPLLGMTHEDWVWRYQHSGRLPGLWQWPVFWSVGLAGAAGALIGAAAGWSLAHAAGEALALAGLRILVGYRRRRSPARLLAAERSRAVLHNYFRIQDSEFIADALAISWVRNVRLGRGPVWLRRLWRRNYLILGVVVLLAWTFALAPAYGSVGTTIAVVGWAVCAPGWARLGDYSRFTDAKNDVLAALGVHVGVGSAVLLLAGLTVVGVGVAIAIWWYVGKVRSKPALVTDYSSFDMGVGIFVSPALVQYYVRGLWALSFAALVHTF